MQRTLKVSILIPVFNVEKYLPKCLDSVLSQTLKSIEIICIDDGSTDGSSDILKQYAKDDNRVKIITKNNTGYGDSMNKGLSMAKGEYIGIVESDDFIDEEAFETLYNLAKVTDADIARANYYHYANGHNVKQEVIPKSLSRKTIDPTKNYFMLLKPPAIWSGIYRRSFLVKNNIKFLPSPGASYQDTGFHFKVWATAKKAVFTTKAFLHYRMDNESSSINNPGKVFCVCDEFSEIERYLSDMGLMNEMNGIFQRAKFGSYLWNIDRLSPKLAKQFIARMSQEYRHANIEKQYFTRKQLCILWLITKFPPTIYYALYRIKRMI